METLCCFKHCSKVSSIFYYKSNNIPDHCPLCELSLKDNMSFVLEPFCVPNPFWNGDHITTTILLLKLSPNNEWLVMYIKRDTLICEHHADTNPWLHLDL